MSQLSEAMKKYNEAREESKSVMESAFKFLNDLMTALNESLTDLETFKQELVKIILNEDINDESKIKELRVSLLKFKPIEVRITYPSSNGQIRAKLTEATQEAFESIQEYGSFREKIADIIRNSEMTAENKIEQISNVLM